MTYQTSGTRTLARDIMTEGTQCVGETETIRQAAEKMSSLGVGALPICGTDNRLKGMLTDRDIVIKALATGKDPDHTPVSELAQGQIATVDADDDIAEVLAIMIEHQVRRVPTLDNNQLVGIVALADVARSLPNPAVGDVLEALSVDY